MAETGLTMPRAAARWNAARLLRIALLLGLWALWEAAAASGIFYRGVVPSTVTIGAALFRLLADGAFYYHLAVTAGELAVALAIGTVAGIAVGLALGDSRFLGRAFEPYLYYLGPTPKIVFLPVLIVMFGVGSGSKVAMGVISCFFPVALSVAAGVREIDRVLLRVGKSFNATLPQMVRKIYLPALVPSLVTGVRLGFGVGVIGVLLAETKLSNRGLGFIAIQDYNHFQIADMYAILIVIFVLSILANGLIARLGARFRADRR